MECIIGQDVLSPFQFSLLPDMIQFTGDFTQQNSTELSLENYLTSAKHGSTHVIPVAQEAETGG